MSARGARPCVGCRHLSWVSGFEYGGTFYCQHVNSIGVTYVDPVHGDMTLPMEAAVRNKEQNCQDWEPRPPSLVSRMLRWSLRW